MIGRKTKLEQTKEKITGVYMIKDKTEGKVYIGESFDIYRRWEQHKGDLINHRHDNYPLQRLYNEYGMDNLEFSIVHEVKNQPCDEITKLYLLYLEEEELKGVFHINRLNTTVGRNVFSNSSCHLFNCGILQSKQKYYEKLYFYLLEDGFNLEKFRRNLKIHNEKIKVKEQEENNRQEVNQILSEYCNKKLTCEKICELLSIDSVDDCYKITSALQRRKDIKYRFEYVCDKRYLTHVKILKKVGK